MYNIYFEAAATGFMVILLIYLHIEYPNASESNRRYRRWVGWILVSLVTDVVASRMTDYGRVIPPILNILVNTAYFVVSAFCFWSLVRYLHSLVQGKLSRIYLKFLNVLLVVYLVLMTLNIFTGWVFTFNEEGVYTHGPLYALIFVFQVIVNSFSIVLLFSSRKTMERRQRAAIWLFMLIILSGFLLQVVLFQKTLLVFYMFSIAAMTVLFVIETPDYIKLADALQEVEEQRKRADIANQAKSNFLANMSHEIRTPMNAIVGLDEMILREEKDPKIRKYASDIKSAGNTLLSIINDILDLSKIESGKMELVPVEYDFSSVLNDIVNMTMKKAQEKGLSYELEVDPTIPSVLYGDEIRIRQIILNLTNNAIKYTQQGSIKIRISYRRSDSFLCCSVKDTGMGIRPEDQDKLFSSFQRLDETKNRKIEGTGLGLNITKQLAEIMGGEVRVESVYGEGSTFTAEMMQKAVNETPIGDYTEHLKEARAENEIFKPRLVAPKARVLIVDDNEMNLEVITELLKETRINISTAESGQECLALLEKETFDLLLLDQMMPGMSGTKTLSILREKHLADDMPVIVLTADAIVGARDSYLKEGFTDYLSKPVLYPEMEDLLKRHLDPGLILSREELEEEEREKERARKRREMDRPVVLVIADSTEELNRAKTMITEDFKGVFVKNEEQAKKYTKKHEVAFIVREGKGKAEEKE